MGRRKFLWLTFLVLALLLLSFSLGFRVGERYAPATAQNEFNIINEVWDALNEEYVDPKALDLEKLRAGAIKGMLEALNDPYTAYLEPHIYQMETANLEGKFQGIGAQVTLRDEQLMVIAPIPGSPADKAGIRAGDKILAVDGQSTEGLSLVEAVLKIRGPKETTVTLRILHEGDTEPVDITIIRAEIDLVSVSYEVKDGLGYLRITHFNERTPSEVSQALRQLSVRGVGGLVLDLRDNPGGLVSSVVEVTSQFVEGDVVLYEVNREGNKQAWKVEPGGLATRLPLVVLVNSYSASGSEVLAGALQDYKRAPLIGTKTFGKGSVNVIRTIAGGSALYVTRARWLTPQGRLIEGQGLLPDIEVELTPEQRAQGLDPQLERAISYLQGRLTP